MRSGERHRQERQRVESRREVGESEEWLETQ